MNERTGFEFVDTLLQSLDDHHGLHLSSVLVARDEILAVAVTGPRGDSARRKRTRPIPVELRVGRYDVRGDIHVIPGTDPIMGFRRRAVMVPLTEPTIEFDSLNGRQSVQVGTLLVKPNADRLDRPRGAGGHPAARDDPGGPRSAPREGLHGATVGAR